MALINCPECDKTVSEKAPTCPNCGSPIAQSADKPAMTRKAKKLAKREAVREKARKNKEEARKNWEDMSTGRKIYTVILGLILACVPGYLILNSDDGGSAKPKPKPKAQTTRGLTDRYTKEQVDAAALFIRESGYSCNKVEAMLPFFTGEGYKVSCDNYRYEYEIANKGGHYVLTVK